MSTHTWHEVRMKETIARHTADVCAAGIGVACIASWLPPIAASLSIVWLCIQIFEYIHNKIKGKK